MVGRAKGIAGIYQTRSGLMTAWRYFDIQDNTSWSVCLPWFSRGMTWIAPTGGCICHIQTGVGHCGAVSRYDTEWSFLLELLSAPSICRVEQNVDFSRHEMICS